MMSPRKDRTIYVRHDVELYHGTSDTTFLVRHVCLVSCVREERSVDFELLSTNMAAVATASGTSIRSSQRTALLRMLELHRNADSRQWHDPWKVLIYDAYCRDIISPLLKVGDLRKQGITLHLLLDSDREAITDVPAIYFVQPTAQNVRRIGKDCGDSLYECYHINFTPAVPRPLLEELAAATLESNSASEVSRVMDQYLNFASLEEDLDFLKGYFSEATSVVCVSEDTLCEGDVETAVPHLVEQTLRKTLAEAGAVGEEEVDVEYDFRNLNTVKVFAATEG